MTPTRKQLVKQIENYHEENLKLRLELREVCCKPESLLSVKVKAEQRYNRWLEEHLSGSEKVIILVFNIFNKNK